MAQYTATFPGYANGRVSRYAGWADVEISPGAVITVTADDGATVTIGGQWLTVASPDPNGGEGYQPGTGTLTYSGNGGRVLVKFTAWSAGGQGYVTLSGFDTVYGGAWIQTYLEGEEWEESHLTREEWRFEGMKYSNYKLVSYSPSPVPWSYQGYVPYCYTYDAAEIYRKHIITTTFDAEGNVIDENTSATNETREENPQHWTVNDFVHVVRDASGASISVGHGMFLLRTALGKSPKPTKPPPIPPNPPFVPVPPPFPLPGTPKPTNPLTTPTTTPLPGVLPMPILPITPGGGVETENEIIVEIVSWEVHPEELRFEKDGGTIELFVGDVIYDKFVNRVFEGRYSASIAPPYGSVSYSSSADWIRFDDKDGAVSIVAEANPYCVERNGVIRLHATIVAGDCVVNAYTTLAVYQALNEDGVYPDDYYAIPDLAVVSLKGIGAQGSVTVGANTQWKVRVEGGDGWLLLYDAEGDAFDKDLSRGDGDKVLFAAKPNESGITREAVITYVAYNPELRTWVDSKTTTIVQEPVVPYLSVITSPYVLPIKGGRCAVTVAANNCDAAAFAFEPSEELEIVEQIAEGATVTTVLLETRGGCAYSDRLLSVQISADTGDNTLTSTAYFSWMKMLRGTLCHLGDVYRGGVKLSIYRG